MICGKGRFKLKQACTLCCSSPIVFKTQHIKVSKWAGHYRTPQFRAWYHRAVHVSVGYPAGSQAHRSPDCRVWRIWSRKLARNFLTCHKSRPKIGEFFWVGNHSCRYWRVFPRVNHSVETIDTPMSTKAPIDSQLYKKIRRGSELIVTKPFISQSMDHFNFYDVKNRRSKLLTDCIIKIN